MPRKPVESFFAKKRQWSEYKDTVLDYYLRPYLQKVKHLGRPIRLFDLYAGPGQFADGEAGSPIILLNRARVLADIGIDIHVTLIEQDPKLAAELRRNTEDYGPLCTVVEGKCEEHIELLAIEAMNKTVFAYIDPFSISRIRLGDMARLYERISLGESVEILFVFMANAFLRWAAARIRAEQDASHVFQDKAIVGEGGDDPFDLELAEAFWDDESFRMAKYAYESSQALDGIAGGDYWRDLAVRSDMEYIDRLQQLVHRYCAKLKAWFNVVMQFKVFGGDSTLIPKYWMIFGSRYLPAIDLMNRAMAKARQKQYEEWKKGTLFANVELPYEMSVAELKNAIVSIMWNRSLTWQSLRWELSRSHCGMFTDTQINNAIKSLLIGGELVGAPGHKVEETAVLRRVDPSID